MTSNRLWRTGPFASHSAWITLALVTAFPSPLAHGSERKVDAAAIPVHYAEGTVHGFLELTTESGELLAHGDLLQVAKDRGISSRMVFHFGKASMFEETVTYTQHEVFTMVTYHLVQSGPAFEDDLDASLTRSGSYVIKTKSHKDGKERLLTGTMKLPPDVYNGMVITIAKNVSVKNTTTVHIVAFTPDPHIIKLELEPSGTQRVLIGQHAETAENFTLKPKLEGFLLLGAKVTGKVPPDSHVWIIEDDVPAFVRSEGPLYSGPVRRIALASPGWPR